MANSRNPPDEIYKRYPELILYIYTLMSLCELCQEVIAKKENQVRKGIEKALEYSQGREIS
jgi:hypothetical protein